MESEVSQGTASGNEVPVVARRRRHTRSYKLKVLAQADRGPGADAILIGRQRQAALDRAIAALPAKLKEPLILTCFEDLSHQAAGELLGVSPKTIETRVYRARRKLSEALGLNEIDPAV